MPVANKHRGRSEIPSNNFEGTRNNGPGLAELAGGAAVFGRIWTPLGNGHGEIAPMDSEEKCSTNDHVKEYPLHFVTYINEVDYTTGKTSFQGDCLEMSHVQIARVDQ